MLQVASSASLPHLVSFAIRAEGAKKVKLADGGIGADAFVQRLFGANASLTYIQIASMKWRKDLSLGWEDLWDWESGWRSGW